MNRIKMGSMACTVISAVITIASDYFEKKAMEKVIEEKVEEVIRKKFS